MATYDKHYQQENYFGNPYPELMSFFRSYPYRGTLADLGAGQGRDSIVITSYSIHYTKLYDVAHVLQGDGIPALACAKVCQSAAIWIAAKEAH